MHLDANRMEPYRASHYSLIGLFKFLLRKWWMFIIVGIVGGLAGIWYAYKQEAKYICKATFSMLDSGGSMGGVLNLAAEFGINIGGSGKDVFAGDNIIVILSSRRIIEEVLLQSDTIGNKIISLADEYRSITKSNTLKQSLTKEIEFKPGSNRKEFSYKQDSVLFTIYDEIVKGRLLSRRPDKKLNFFEISFISPNERFSRLFVERLIEVTSSFYTTLRTQKSKATLDILEARVGAVRGSASAAIQSQAGIRDANINPAFALAGASVLNKQLDVTAYGRAYEELFKNLELARYQYLQDIPLFQVIDPPRLPLKNMKPGRLYSGIVFAIISCFVTLVLLVSISIIKRDVVDQGKGLSAD
jgi:hypothetical protein